MKPSITEYSDSRFSVKLENGIMHISYKQEFVDYDYVNDLINKRLEISGKKSYPMLSDFRIVKNGSRDARQRFAEKDAGEGVDVVAIVVKSKVQKMMYEFFNMIYKAPAPAKLFTDKEQALKWLEKQKMHKKESHKC